MPTRRFWPFKENALNTSWTAVGALTKVEELLNESTLQPAVPNVAKGIKDSTSTHNEGFEFAAQSYAGEKITAATWWFYGVPSAATKSIKYRIANVGGFTEQVGTIESSVAKWVEIKLNANNIEQLEKGKQAEMLIVFNNEKNAEQRVRETYLEVVSETTEEIKKVTGSLSVGTRLSHVKETIRIAITQLRVGTVVANTTSSIRSSTGQLRVGTRVTSTPGAVRSVTGNVSVGTRVVGQAQKETFTPFVGAVLRIGTQLTAQVSKVAQAQGTLRAGTRVTATTAKISGVAGSLRAGTRVTTTYGRRATAVGAIRVGTRVIATSTKTPSVTGQLSVGTRVTISAKAAAEAKPLEVFAEVLPAGMIEHDTEEGYQIAVDIVPGATIPIDVSDA